MKTFEHIRETGKFKGVSGITGFFKDFSDEGDYLNADFQIVTNKKTTNHGYF